MRRADEIRSPTRGGEPVAELSAQPHHPLDVLPLGVLDPLRNLDVGLLEILGSISKILSVILIVSVVYIRGLDIPPPAAFVCFASYLAFMTVSALLRNQGYLPRLQMHIYVISMCNTFVILHMIY